MLALDYNAFLEGEVASPPRGLSAGQRDALVQLEKLTPEARAELLIKAEYAIEYYREATGRIPDVAALNPGQAQALSTLYGSVGETAGARAEGAQPYDNPIPVRGVDKRLIDPVLRARNSAPYQALKAQLRQIFGTEVVAKDGNTEVSNWAQYMVGKARRMLRFGDIHFHRLPYDRRLGLGIHDFLKMVNEGIDEIERTAAKGKLDEQTTQDLKQQWIRVAFGAIPQGCGKGYYASTDSWRLTFKNAARLDDRFAREYLTLAPGEQAQADVMLTGYNPAKAGFREYAERMLKQYPGVFKGIGELTIHKEYVSALLGDEQVTLDNQNLREVFAVAQDTGLVLLIHCDWGEAKAGSDHRLVADSTGYEHFEKLIKLAEQYPDARVVLAHTGLGRYAKADMTPVQIEFNGETKQVPRHVALLYHAIKRVPGLHFDISWNDVADAYLFHPDMGDALIDFTVENPERVLYGSDAVKPANLAQYLQNFTTLQPLLDALDAIDPHAAWLLERGNYERLFNAADEQVANWTRSRLDKGGAERMDAMLQSVREERDRQLGFVMPEPEKIRAANLADKANNPQPGAAPPAQTASAAPVAARSYTAAQLDQELAALLDVTPHTETPVLVDGRARDLVQDPQALELLEHLVAHDSTRQALLSSKVRAQLLKPRFSKYLDPTLRSLLANKPLMRHLQNQYEAAVRSDEPVVPSSGDIANENKRGILLTAGIGGLLAAGALVGIDKVVGPHPWLDSAAFMGRGALNAARTFDAEWDRYFEEAITEQALITDRHIGLYIDKLEELGPKYGIAAWRIDQAVQISRQFGTEIDFIQKNSLQAGESDWDRAILVSAAAGLWKIRIDGALGIQSASPSLTTASPRTRLGQLFRGGVATTFLVNLAANTHHIMTDSPHGVLQTAMHAAYGLADLGLFVHYGMGLVSGIAGSNWEERIPFFRKLQPYGATGFAAGSGLLTLVDVTTMIGTGGWSAAAIAAKIAADAFLAGSTARQAREAILVDQRLGAHKPGSVSRVAYVAAAALFARGLLQILFPDKKDKQGTTVSNKPTVTSTPTPASTPSPNPTASATPPGPSTPPNGNPPGGQPPTNPPPSRKKVVVQVNDSLWTIGAANIDTLLTAEEKKRVERERMSKDQQTSLALMDLIQINPQRHFDVALIDGKPTRQPGDPDLLRPGWELYAGR